MLSFKKRHFPKDIILQAVRGYLTYALSYRDLQEILAEHQITVDHSALCRWVQTYTPQLEAVHRKRRPVCGLSWRMDETYIKVAGRWIYPYRAVDSHTDETVDFLQTRHRDKKATLLFFKKAIAKHGVPSTGTIDKSGVNTAALEALNVEQKEAGRAKINIRQNKYLNNLVEQDLCGTKKITKPMMGFKSFLGLTH